MAWNFADVWDAIALATPQAPALVHGGCRRSWGGFERRSRGLAAHLLAAGLQRQDKVALYLYNDPAYLEGAYACFKAALVPVNVNYRYQHEELLYLFDNADAAAVVFHGEFTPRIEELRARCPKVRTWVQVDDGTHPCPPWAVPYEAAAGTAGAPAPQRTGDDLVLVYTGGTTGRPRGVMWRQDDLFVASNTAGDPPDGNLGHVRDRLARAQEEGRRPPRGVPAAPLMHGTAFVFACSILTRGGAVVTATGRSFDAAELLDLIDAEAVTDLCIVGDAFARPMLDRLDAAPGRWRLSTVKAISSSGMLWSDASKDGLLRHLPQALLVDFLNSSEASGMGKSVRSSGRGPAGGARFKLGQNALVIDEDNRPVAPGSGVAGRVAVRGRVPLGYYNDPAKTAATFPVIDGVRHAVPGDYARVEADGTIALLGRGSVSINTGGEKVYPEEVEQCIKELPGVADALLVGVPDPRFGEVVTALVQPTRDADVEPGQVTAHVRQRLARHKVPRHVLLVERIDRGPNGKADYPAARRHMQEWLAGRSDLTQAS
ncbi:MAG TPA: AMP-binding protein [Ramlibacter sp.]|nr:AMP-binding protein [Ramlibacter sp.]